MVFNEHNIYQDGCVCAHICTHRNRQIGRSRQDQLRAPEMLRLRIKQNQREEGIIPGAYVLINNKENLTMTRTPNPLNLSASPYRMSNCHYGKYKIRAGCLAESS